MCDTRISRGAQDLGQALFGGKPGDQRMFARAASNNENSH
jgi:hypothetical protein